MDESRKNETSTLTFRMSNFSLFHASKKDLLQAIKHQLNLYYCFFDEPASTKQIDSLLAIMMHVRFRFDIFYGSGIKWAKK